MRLRTTPIRTVAVPPAKPRNPVVLAVVQRLGTLAGHRHEDRKSCERLDRLDLDQRVREIGEW
ncbi:MAG: short-chain dehydrogenase [Pseudomonadota bacterium]